MSSQKALQHLNSALHAFGAIQQRDQGQQRDSEEDWEQNWIQVDGNSVMTPQTLWNMPFDHSITGQRTYDVRGQTVGKYWVYVRRTLQLNETNNVKSDID